MLLGHDYSPVLYDFCVLKADFTNLETLGTFLWQYQNCTYTVMGTTIRLSPIRSEHEKRRR
jgi:hypothetical protein